MTKLTKNFTIELEICEKLKEENNASQLVETLLKRHYSNKKYESKEELEKEIKELSTNHIEIETKLKELNIRFENVLSQEIETNNFESRIPQDIKDYCEKFTELSENEFALKSVYQKLFSKENLTEEEFIKYYVSQNKQ